MISFIGRPRNIRRLLIAEVVKSILVYATPLWARALNNVVNRWRRNSIYWPGAYKATSAEVMCVIERMILLNRLANEARYLHQLKGVKLSEVAAGFQRAITKGQ